MKIEMFTLGAMESNSYVVPLENNHCILVDVGEEPTAILKYLAENNLTPLGILLTHGHYDHIAGVGAVQSVYPTPVYIHEFDAPMLTDGELNLAPYLSPVPLAPISDVHTFREKTRLTFENMTFVPHLTPGHTRGSVCFLTEKVMFSGDTLFRLSCGRTDFPSGSPTAMTHSLQYLCALEGDYAVYPGHGAPTTLAYERKNNPFVRDSARR